MLHATMNFSDIVVGVVQPVQATDCGLRSSAGQGSAAAESADMAVGADKALQAMVVVNKNDSIGLCLCRFLKSYCSPDASCAALEGRTCLLYFILLLYGSRISES